MMLTLLTWPPAACHAVLMQVECLQLSGIPPLETGEGLKAKVGQLLGEWGGQRAGGRGLNVQCWATWVQSC